MRQSDYSGDNISAADWIEPSASDHDSGLLKYWAFISYSHYDESIANWLLRCLENHPVPKDLQERSSIDGAQIGKYLRPIFRDRDELASSYDLGGKIHQGLQGSRYLVVIASPNSAKSKWVNEEINIFKKMGRGNRILVLLVGGIPNSPTSVTECFPPALRGSQEPIAADLRREGDGKTRAYLKIVAGIIEADFDKLFRRHERAAAKIRLLQTTVSLALVVSFGLLATFSILQKRTALAERERAKNQARLAISARNDAEDILRFVHYDMRDHLSRLGRLDLMKAIDANVLRYYEKNPASSPDARRLYAESDLKYQNGKVLLALKELDEASAAFKDALALAKLARSASLEDRRGESEVRPLMDLVEVSLLNSDFEATQRYCEEILGLCGKRFEVGMSEESALHFSARAKCCLAKVLLADGKVVEAVRSLELLSSETFLYLKNSNARSALVHGDLILIHVVLSECYGAMAGSAPEIEAALSGISLAKQVPEALKDNRFLEIEGSAYYRAGRAYVRAGELYRENAVAAI